MYTSKFEAPYKIIQMEIQDLPQMLPLWNQYYLVLSSSKRFHTLSSLNLWYNDRHKENHEYFGLFEENKLHGFVILKYEIEKIWIKFLVVDDKFQQQGLGKEIIEFTLKEAKRDEIYTEVLIPNYEALTFFVLQGFRIISYDQENEQYILHYKKDN